MLRFFFFSLQKSVISAYVKRAFTHCSTWKDLHAELDRIRQLLTNNGYTDKMIEAAISKKMEEFNQQATGNPIEESLTIYHRLDYSSAYREECQALKGIFSRGVTPRDPYKKIHLRIFSKPNLTSSLVMRNSTAPIGTKEMRTNVVYKFVCPEEMCKSHAKDYIGHTSTTIRRRLLAHRNQGSIHQHYVDVHDRKPSLQELIDSTSIIHKESNYSRLLISEAVSIVTQKPSLNIQQETDTLLPSSRGRRQRRPNNQDLPAEDIRGPDEADIALLIRSLRRQTSRRQ